MKPTHVQLIIANKSGKFLEGNSAATMSAEQQQLERPSRFKAGARVEPGEAAKGVTAALLQPPSWGSRLQGRRKCSFKSNRFSIGRGLWELVPG